MLQLLLLAALGVAAQVAHPHAGARARSVAAGPEQPALRMRALSRRDDDPTYAPQEVDCPSDKPKIRDASGLSDAETKWLVKRRKATVKPMTDFLTRAGIRDFNAGDYMSSVSSDVDKMPNVGIAVSGGGYRALMNGGGFLMAADERTPSSTTKGGIGGLLQSATYLSGLSGGGWLVGSIFSNNFSTVEQLRDGGKVWNFDRSIIAGPDDFKLGRIGYWTKVIGQVDDKRDADFDVSLTDYWGRMLAFQLINGENGGPANTWSSLAQMPAFQNAETPFPLIVAVGRAPKTKIIALNSTVFEFNPFELGSWDPTAYGFAPMEYIGSKFKDGAVQDNTKCVRHFDSSSFVMGTSSSLFNTLLIYNLSDYGVPDIAQGAIKKIAEEIDEDNNDIASYKPNPFFGYHNKTAGGIATSEMLALVDGGEDLQNIPLTPLIQPVRKVDVVFAVDSSADTKNNWPDGAAIRATYDRSQSPMANGTQFPAVPDRDTFFNEGLNSRPTFFGCDTGNFSTKNGASAPPLIVYIPNAPYTSKSNVATFTLDYTTALRNDILMNGYNGATQGNGTLDAEWPACVACAVLQRSLLRTKTSIPSQCQSCFDRYCWDGKVNNTQAADYDPTFKISDQSTANATSAASSYTLGRGGFGSGSGSAFLGFWLAVVAAAAMGL